MIYLYYTGVGYGVMIPTIQQPRCGYKCMVERDMKGANNH